MLQRFRTGLTAIEMVLAIGLLSIATGLFIPSYRNSLIRSDLELARQRVAQGIERAKFLSQVGMNDASWGFAIDIDNTNYEKRGVIFMGEDFATSDAGFHEYYPIPKTINPHEGSIEVVWFEKGTGNPSVTGIILLKTDSGEEREINISVGDAGNVSIPQEWIAICINPGQANSRTISVPDSLLEYYLEQSATQGACGSNNPPVPPDGPPPPAGVPLAECNPLPCNFDEDKLTPEEDFTCTLKVIGANLEGSGIELPITVDIKIGGGSWESPFGDYTKPVDANVNKIGTSEDDCQEYLAFNSIYLRAKAWEKKNSNRDGSDNNDWKELSPPGEINTDTSDKPAYVHILRDGDAMPAAAGSYYETFLPLDFSTTPPTVDIGVSQYLYLFELGTEDPSLPEFDLQDLALLLTIEGTL